MLNGTISSMFLRRQVSDVQAVCFSTVQIAQIIPQILPEWFLAGVLAGLPDIMPCLVPTVNGYKRLVEKYVKKC